MSFKKFSMYNENEQTTASDGTGKPENSLDDETMETAEHDRIVKEKDDIIDALKKAMLQGNELYAHLKFDDEPFTPYQLALQQLEEYKQALRELIIILDYYHDQQVTYTEMPYKTWNAIIEKARKSL